MRSGTPSITAGANITYVVLCSSDLWSGLASAK